MIGSGPNGLAAAIVCASAGLQVTVYEAASEIGGAVRTAPLTRAGFLHDLGASIFPFGAASPFFRALPLEAHGLAWVHPRYALAHPLDDEEAVVLERSVEATAAALGPDRLAYQRLLTPFTRAWESLIDEVLAPVHWPAHPWQLARFGLAALPPATVLARKFRTPRARALVAGLAAHSGEPLEAPLTSAFAVLLAVCAHAGGWPVARGGAASVTAALAGILRELGAEIRTRSPVAALDDLPRAAVTLCDVAPEHLARLGGARLGRGFVRRLRRFRRSGAVFKVDWALDGPIPWRDAACAAAGTVHVGGTLAEIAESERAVRAGRPAERPFVIVAQPSSCDPSRAPVGRQAAWGYCHVPLGAVADMTAAIEAQVERFAPGFHDRILARHVLAPADLMRVNANLVGGDIGGGAFRIGQFLTRPTWRRYGTPLPDVYLCSASTPPGGGVHGMCGYWAARTALERLRLGRGREPACHPPPARARAGDMDVRPEPDATVDP